tara:strand:- start:154 stop:612 length:459 start_codon:yes stop_codon:yes gene_type:complete
MIKKIILTIFLYLFLINCDYKPIYSLKNNNNFDIRNIEFEGDQIINGLLNQKILRFKKDKSDIKYDLKIASNYNKKSLSKDTAGITTKYQLTLSVNFMINSKNLKDEIKIVKKFSMKNIDNKFDEQVYENNIKNNLSDMVLNDLIIYLNRLQ